MKVVVITSASDGIGRINALVNNAGRAAQALLGEVVMTGKGKLGRWLKLLLPGLVEKLALNALKDDAKPH